MVPRKAPEESRTTWDTEKSLLPSTDASMLPDSNGLPDPSDGPDVHAASSRPTKQMPVSLLIVAILDRRPTATQPTSPGWSLLNRGRGSRRSARQRQDCSFSAR